MQKRLLNRKVENFNIIYIGFIILWPIIKQTILHVDGAGRGEILFSLIAIIVNWKQIFKIPSAMYFWIAWVVYNIINTYFKGFFVEGYPYPVWVLCRLFVPLAVMLVAYQTLLYGRKDIYQKLFYFFLFYTLLGSFGLVSKEAHDIGTRYVNEMGNSYFNTLILSATYAAICFYKKNISPSLSYSLLFFSFEMIILSGERKGLLCFLIILFGFWYAKNAGKGLKSIISTIGLFIIGYLGISYLMEFTTAGMRMTNSLGYSEYNDNWFLKIMADRAVMYVDGWNAFMENFWTGLGLMNGPNKIVGMRLMFHTEYMVQLAECGMMGFTLFLFFYLSMLKRSIKLLSFYVDKKINYILFFTLISIIAINFVSWTYDNTFYFMFFGFLFAQYDRIKLKIV